MGIHYEQLCLSERIEIYRLHREGKSLRRIAVALDRSPSTISRELRRNAKPTKAWSGGYCAERADTLATRRRRWDGRFKLARQPDLRELVRDRLAMGWSPEQIAGRLALDHGRTVISHESIYRFIYHRSAQKDYWHRMLPQAKHRRGRLRRGGPSPLNHIKARVPVASRPDDTNQRREPGHWEADLMLFAKYGQAILVTHERMSRYTHITRQPNKAAQPVVDSLRRQFEPMPATLRRSITYDNGTEFSYHYHLNESLGIASYFCDAYAPWQKGGVENAIGRIRRSLPRKSDLAEIGEDRLQALALRYNQTPRKCLGFKTPNEVFNELLNNVALQT